jgi:hypothetical protein
VLIRRSTRPSAADLGLNDYFVLAGLIPFQRVPQLTKASEGVRDWFRAPDGGSGSDGGKMDARGVGSRVFDEAVTGLGSDCRFWEVAPLRCVFPLFIRCLPDERL